VSNSRVRIGTPPLLLCNTGYDISIYMIGKEKGIVKFPHQPARRQMEGAGD
jgi:hypothetical protein